MGVLDTLCIELTKKCPLRCQHCSANAAPERGEMMPVGVLSQRLAELGRLSEVYLSGGEPFEHPDILAAIAAASGVAASVIAYSSGVIGASASRQSPLSEELLASARQAGLRRIDLSLYSASAVEHDAITETINSHATTCESATNARQVGLEVGIHYVPMTTSLDNINQLILLAEHLGASRFHMLALTTQGRARPDKTFARLLPTKILLESLHDVLAKKHSLDIILSSELLRQLGKLDRYEKQHKKASFIDVDGFLYPDEGQQIHSMRSLSSILRGSTIESLVREVSRYSGKID